MALALPLALACGSRAEEPATRADRVVLIVVDTLRRDHLSVYSDRVPTPNVEALAARGQVFGNAWSSYHQTTMTMASLFTGRTPSIERGRDRQRLDWTGETWCGMARFASNEGAPVCIPPPVGTLAEAYRAAGYWTAGVTSNKLLYRPGGYERGFDRWVEIGQGHPTAAQVNRAVLDVLRERPSDHFLLYVHYMDVHDHMRRGRDYASGVRIVDAALGELLAHLDELGLMEGAVVVLTSDHGEHLEGEAHMVPASRGHTGSPSFDTLLQVPLVVAPAIFRGTNAMVRSDDVHRMLLALAGAGSGPEPELRAGEIFLSEREFQTYRMGRWKSFRHRKSGTHLLADLTADPGETTNVAAQHPVVRRKHAARMDALAERLGAPDSAPAPISQQDRARLRALGYEADD